MGTVLRSVSPDDLIISVIPLDGEANLDDMIALLHHGEDAPDFGLPRLQVQPASLHVLQIVHQLVLHDDAGPVEEVLDHVEEFGVSMRGNILQAIGNLVLRITPVLKHDSGRGDSQLQEVVGTLRGGERGPLYGP